MKDVELKIKGMHCKSCTMVIGEALTDIQGVSDAKVDLNSNTAKISFDESKVKTEDLIKAIRKEGYDARI